jgi:hypothetical protein
MKTWGDHKYIAENQDKLSPRYAGPFLTINTN